MPRWDTRPGSNCAAPGPAVSWPPHAGWQDRRLHGAFCPLRSLVQGCDEPFSGDAWRSRLREWLMTSSLPQHDRYP